MSPDAVYDGIGLEIKTPAEPGIFVQQCQWATPADVKGDNKSYYLQCVAGLVATGYRYWVLLSFNPRDKPGLPEASYVLFDRTNEPVAADVATLAERVEVAQAASEQTWATLTAGLDDVPFRNQSVVDALAHVREGIPF